MSLSPKSSKVLLPTFEQMMRVEPGQKTQVDAHTQLWALEEQLAQTPQEDELEAELPKDPTPEELLAQAQAQCEALLEEAARQAETILHEAEQQALRIVQQTRKEEAARAQAELDKALELQREAVLASAQALEQAKGALFDALEPRLLDTAIRIAERILSSELDRNEKAYLAIVKNVLEQSFSRQEVVLYLPVERFALLMGGAEAEGEITPFAAEMAKRGVEVRRDPLLDAWDCLVTTDMGSVRGGAATQLARIKAMASGGERI